MVQFNNVPVVGRNGYIEVDTAFRNDISPVKVDLVFGTFRSEDSSQYLLPVVKRAENMVLNDTSSHDYLSPAGIEGFTKSASGLLLGDIDQLWKEGMVFGVQCIGGAGALKIGAEFLSRHMNCTTVYYPDPSYEIHGTIFAFSGFQNTFEYRYLNRETKAIDFDGLCEDISNASVDSVVILHACGHNPTGLDLTKDQWIIIAEIMKERKLIPFFDIAYQGMASGDIEEDAWAIRYFHSEAYRLEDGSNYLLPVVKKAENMVVNDTSSHDYLSPTGIEGFTKSACRLLLGDIEKLWKDGKVFGVQCIGGTGALKIGAEFLSRHMNCTTVYYPDPSWEMHGTVFSFSGFQNKIKYRYMNRETIEIDFEGLCEDISNAPVDSVVILHACGHNPTGLDLSKEQWRTIAEIMKERKLIPFFDIAYQGMASGDIEEDTWAVRHFHSEGIEFLCAQSFSKMFTMYNERVGNLTIVQKSGHNIESLKVHLERIIRSLYSSPPNHGARAVFQILSNPELYDEWSSCFKAMAARMIELRKAFRKALEEEGAFRKWNHITDQKGMFILLHLTDNQVEYLRKFHHIYMVNFGRVNVSGLNFTNISYVAKAIIDTLRKNI